MILNKLNYISKTILIEILIEFLACLEGLWFRALVGPSLNKNHSKETPISARIGANFKIKHAKTTNFIFGTKG